MNITSFYMQRSREIRRPLHSRTPDLTRPRTGDPVELGVRPQLDTLSEAFLQICHRFAFFNEPRRHKVTESREHSAFVPSCLCGETNLWQIYGGAKGFNPASMLNRVCNSLVVTKVQRPKGAVEKKNRDKLPLFAPKRAFSQCSGTNRGILE